MANKKMTAEDFQNMEICKEVQMGHFESVKRGSLKLADVFGRIALFMAEISDSNIIVVFDNNTDAITINWYDDSIGYSFVICYEKGFCVLHADCAPTVITDVIVDICMILGCDTTFFRD